MNYMKNFIVKMLYETKKTIKDIKIKLQIDEIDVTVNNIPLKICTKEFKIKVNEVLTNIINFNKV